MTAHKRLKQLIRARMQKTGERYAAARRHVLRQAPPPAADPAARWHFAGGVPATTALRVLLAHAGLRAPHTGEPFSEALLFVVAGGVGAGVFSFLYEQQDAASFFVAGRHSWQDDLAYLRDACARLGIAPDVRESGGAKAAVKQLRQCLADGPCVAWVDMAHLPHRALPAVFSGGGYHVVTVYRVDDDDGTALVGDLTDAPIAVPLSDLEAARARIKKQKNRLLRIPASPSPVDPRRLVREGLEGCHRGLTGAGAKRAMSNFTLEAFRTWAERLHGSRHEERWERVFAPGQRLWRGLTAIHEYVEHYGTGGGLCRPIFADGLSEAAAALGRPALRPPAERYAELGRAWAELADAALPDDVPQMREAKELYARKAELTHSGGPSAGDEIRDIWKRLGQLAEQVRGHFPLTEAECADLRAGLQRRVTALYDRERAAHAALGEAIAAL